MPLYEYRCTQCGHRFEKIQSFTAEPLTACPKCGGTLERPLTAPAFQFKGAGWYVNDYAPKAASGSSSSAADSATPAADSKPAATEAPAAQPAAKPAEPAKPASTTSSS